MRITLVLAAAALAAGCSSAASKPAVQQLAPAVGTSAPAAAASSPAPAGAPSTLKLGATATLTTPSGPLEVTVLKVVDPAKPKESYIYPTRGERWIGIEFKFANKGTKALIDSPMAGIEATDNQGQPQRSFPDQNVAAGPLIDPLYGLHLQPGDTTTGYLVWSVPDGTKLARVRYTPPGGSPAQWTLS